VFVSLVPFLSLSYSQSFDLLACPSCENGVITGIVDGDTVDINERRVRLSLVDTPERGDDGYAEATQFTSDLCPVGTVVFFDSDSMQPVDKYGRLVGVVYCNGINLNEALLQNMLAEPASMYCNTSEFAQEAWVETICARGDTSVKIMDVTPMVKETEQPILPSEFFPTLEFEYLYLLIIPVIVAVIFVIKFKHNVVSGPTSSKDKAKKSVKYVWYEMMPKSQEYEATEIMENLLAHLSDFALVVEKSKRLQLDGFRVVPESATLRLYFRVRPVDSHVLTSIPGYEFRALNGKPQSEFIAAITLKPRKDFVLPFTTDVQKCAIYDAATDMPNFLVGIVCKQVDGEKIIKRAHKFIFQKKEEWDSVTKSVKEKAEQSRFFVANVFFNTDEESIVPPINFMGDSEPNSLVRDSLVSTFDLFNSEAKLKSFGKSTVLSVPEIISILSLPEDTRKLLVNFGHDDTFASPAAVVDSAEEDVSYLAEDDDSIQ